MEARRKTRPGVLIWTPAPPAQNSSEDSCEDEDDFFTQMDENGIIGLSEDLEEVELGHHEREPPESPEPGGPQEVDLVQGSVEKPADGLSFDVRKSREDRVLPTRHDMKVGSKVDQRAELRPGRDPAEDQEELVRTSGSPPRDKFPPEVSHCPRSVSQSCFLPHRCPFSADELAAAPGIDAETLPDVSESLPDSLSSRTSSKSSPRRLETTLGDSPHRHKPSGYGPTDGEERPQEEPRPSLRTHEAERSRASTGGSETDSPKPEQNQSQKTSRIPRLRNDAAEGEGFRRGSPSRQTPDFSKVEPRVCFPRRGYNPPRSKQPLTRTMPEPPMAFKSPADIVNEVLFNTDGSSTSSGSPTHAANFTVPPEFRCRQQASTLLQQLQDDYSRLLTKYAEAENTIDRLRLEAKGGAVEKQQLRSRQTQPLRDRAVNLNFDPPETRASVRSGLNHHASKFLELDLAAAQRAEVLPGRPGPNGVPQDPSRPPLEEQLLRQTETFLQQLQSFEDLLRSEKLSPCEKTEGVSQLSEELNSLGRSYLLACDEHKLLQQRGAEDCRFDAERELGGLIFQCELRVEELKEQQTSPPPPSSSSSEEEPTVTRPQILPAPFDPAEPSSAREKTEEEEEEDEETLVSFSYRPNACVDSDSTKTGSLSKALPPVPSSPDLKASVQPGSEEEEQSRRRTGNHQAVKTPSQSRRVESDQDSPVCARKQRSCSRVGPSSVAPGLPARSRRRLELRRSHSSSLSSLAETTSDRRSSKAQTGTRRVLPQDGLVSPETDSGFVGSESSRPTPAAAPGLLHRRAAERDSLPRDADASSPHLVLAPPPLSLSHTAQEPPVGPQLDPNQPRRTRPGQRRRTFSCSPQRCVGQRQTRAGSRTREPGSETPSSSEVDRRDRFSGSVNSPLSSHSGSSPAASYLHGDSPRAPSFSRGGNHSDAVVELQVEVTRLREKIKHYMTYKKHFGSETAAPSARLGTFTPPVRFVEVWSDDRLGRREPSAAEDDEPDSASGRTTGARSTSAQKQRRDVLTRSELDPRPHVSRCTQTSAEPRSCSSPPARSRNTRTCQNSASEAADEPDGPSPAPFCPRCPSNLRGGAQQPRRGSKDPKQSCCCRCSLCGGLRGQNHAETDCSKRNPSSHQNLQPAEPPHIWRSVTAAASPPALHFLPVYPPQLLLCSTPLHTSPYITGVPSGPGRPEERTGRTRRPLSVDRHRSLDGSLNRAVRAARRMKLTSGHMARSLASGLQHQDQDRVSQSCSY
ncbi:microtubule organization protein AKNA [Nematolebias whitei]|uniref:microtubule organization protein AKNA n=1 Tax=Nematolebias whitei TaxID=451745 RepID=UPI00189C3684|nr:microtubule organization protein AKNA [Nematolebias whitei]